MSKWTHSLCEDCYKRLEPGRTPHRVVNPKEGPKACCNCSTIHESGIYYRADPTKMLCRGLHD